MILLNGVPFAVLVLMNAFLCVTAKRKFGRMLPMTMMAVGLMLFISQMVFGTFLVGLIPAGACAAGGAVSLILLRKKESYRELVFTNGFRAFLAVFLVFFVMDFGRHLSGWDELMHWGKMVKQMLRLDRFYCVPESTLLNHKDYPPFLSLIEYFWCRLSGGFSDMGVMMSLHVFQLGLIVPVLAEGRETGKRIRDGVLRGILGVVFFAAMMVALDRYGTFDKIYTDIPIGIMFAFTMYWVWSKEAYRGCWGYLTFCLSLVGLVLAKQIGIGFAAAAYFYFAISGIRKPIRFRTIALGLLPLILCGAGYWVWSRLIASYNISGQFDLKGFTVDGVLSVLKSGGAQADTLKQIIKQIFKTNIVNGLIPITYASSILLMVMIPELFHLTNRERFPRREKNLTIITLAGGAIGYAGAIAFLYAFCFFFSDPHEAGTFLSYPRYMGSYLTGGMIFLAMTAVTLYRERIIDRLSNRKLFIALLAFMVLFNYDTLQDLMPGAMKGDPMHPYEVRAEKINARTEEGKRVYPVYTFKTGDEAINLSYYTDDVYIDTAYMDLLHIDFEKDPKALDNAVEILKKDDYLYLFEVTESFNRAFSKYNGGHDFAADEIYVIDSTENEIRVRLL